MSSSSGPLDQFDAVAERVGNVAPDGTRDLVAPRRRQPARRDERSQAAAHQRRMWLSSARAVVIGASQAVKVAAIAATSILLTMGISLQNGFGNPDVPGGFLSAALCTTFCNRPFPFMKRMQKATNFI